MSDQKKPYTPIACSAYDVLESAAVLRHQLELRLEDGTAVRGTVRDVYARGLEEYCVLEPGPGPLRLDRIVTITDLADGREYPTRAC